MGNPVIIDAVRTPLGKRKGWLAGVHPAVLIGQAMNEVLSRAGIDSDLVDQVVGPSGLETVTEALARTDCPIAPELFKSDIT